MTSSTSRSSSTSQKTPLLTPERLPKEPQRVYSAKKIQRIVNGKMCDSLSINFTPNAKKKYLNGLIYSWTISFQNSPDRSYVGETIQSLRKRSYQHIRQGATTQNIQDIFHNYLQDYAENPKSQITKITVSLREKPDQKFDLRKTEALYILAENTHISKGGLNAIHAQKSIARKNLLNELNIAEEKTPQGKEEYVITNKNKRQRIINAKDFTVFYKSATT